jgi:hypothetical protein
MKLFRAIILGTLLLLSSFSAKATDVTISAGTVQNFRATGLQPTRTGTLSVTNGIDSVTCTNCLENELIGQSGFRISIVGVDYTVDAVTSRSAFSLSTNYAASTNASASYTLYPVVFIRLYASINFLPLGGTSIVQAGAVGSNNFYIQRAASVINNTIYLPEITVPATTDTAMAATRDARFSARFHRINGSEVQVYGGFNSFAIPPNPTTTTWGELLIFNTAQTQRPADERVYNVGEVNSLLDTIITATPEYILKADSAHRAENSGMYQDSTTVTNTLITDNKGGIPSKTAAEIAALSTAGRGDGSLLLDSTNKRYVRFNATTGKWVPENGGAYDVDVAGAKGDGETLSCSINSSSSTLTCGSASFTSAYTGKAVVVLGAGANGAALTTTGTYASATTLTLANAASTTVAGATSYIASNSTTAIQSAIDRADANGGGDVVLQGGKYYVTSLALKKKVTFRGQGLEATELWSAASGGIVKSTWPANSSTAVDIKVRDLTIRALDTRLVQTCLEEQGGTYVHVDRVRFKDCHYGMIMNQTEVSGVRNSRFETYSASHYGGLKGSTDPTTANLAGANAWTKTGAGSTASDGSRWQINGTSTYYSKSLNSAAFVKGFTLFMKIPEIVSGDASQIVIDNGTHKYTLTFPAINQVKLNGGTTRTTTLSSRLRLEIAIGGATATLKIDGATVDSNIAGAAGSSATLTWGGNATANATNTYWQDFFYVSSNPLPASVWMVSGPDYDPAYTGAEYTNIIYLEENQFNATTFSIASDGGYEHSIKGNNFNAGLISLWNQGSYSVQVTGNSFELQELGSVWVSGSTLQGSSGGAGGARIKFQGNTFAFNGPQGYKGVQADNATNLIFDGNTFTQSTYVPLYFDTSGSVTNVTFSGKNTTGGGQALSNLTSSHIYPTVENVVKSFTTISPTQITANQNDYNPGDTTVIRVTSDAARDITGLVAAMVDGTEKEIWNDGSFDITLKHASSSSTAANRFSCEGSLDLVIGAGQGARLRYYNALSRWKVTLLQ